MELSGHSTDEITETSNIHTEESSQANMSHNIDIEDPSLLDVAQAQQQHDQSEDEAVIQRAETDPLRAARNTCLANFIRKRNRLLAIFCLVSIFVDPLFFFTIHVNKENNCISINWGMAKALVVMTSITDFVYLLNILLQFMLAYVSPKSNVVDGPTKIALKYCKGYFLIDLCVVLPLPQILFLFLLPNSPKSDGEYHAKMLLFILILLQYVLGLFIFLCLLIGQSPSGFIFKFKSAGAIFVINLLFFVLFSHIVGSCWYIFALQVKN